MSHSRAVASMVLVAFLWSLAGVVARHLDSARSFEVTFWRSLFNACALTLALGYLRGPALWQDIVRAPPVVWASGLCWSVMYTAFMVAVTLTTVANVLVTLAFGPLMTALFARVVLHHRLPARTWAAIVVGGAGIAWMFASQFDAGASFAGVLVAFAVPVAAAVNWTLLQHVGHGSGDPEGEAPQDMLPAVLIGAVLSALAMLPFSLPFAATPKDLGLLAFLGTVQLAIPCLMVVRLTRHLSAPEIALLGSLEVVFGVALAWIGAGEKPGASAIVGGALVVGALVVNEALALRYPARVPR